LRKFALLAVCIFGALLTVAGSALAAESTIEVSIGSEPVESITTQLGAAGTHTDGLYKVHWSVHPAGGAGCGPNPLLDSGNIAMITPESSSGTGDIEQAYSSTGNWTPEVVGSYLLCGWLEGLDNEIVVAHTSMPISVRPPHLSVALSVPARVQAGHTFQITTTAQAEATRELYEYILPNAGAGCPANAAAASSASGVIDPSFGSGATANIWSVNGGPSSKTFNQMLKNAGVWRVCAYYQYHGTSSPPEGFTSATVTVVAPAGQRCVVPSLSSKMRLSTIERRIRAAHCSVGKIHHASSARYRRGTVIKLSPGPGTTRPSHTAVQVFVSSGQSSPRQGTILETMRPGESLSTQPKVVIPTGAAPSQLVIKDIIKGTGSEARAGELVTVNYVGVLYQGGKIFDSSWKRGEPFSFRLGRGEVIPGWEQGVPGMRVGGRRELIIPPALAYGTTGSPPSIPPNASLVFVVDLLAA
jgi:FKBP-type peptidyl-prolyl cis-trans isomerase